MIWPCVLCVLNFISLRAALAQSFLQEQLATAYRMSVIEMERFSSVYLKHEGFLAVLLPGHIKHEGFLTVYHKHEGLSACHKRKGTTEFQKGEVARRCFLAKGPTVCHKHDDYFARRFQFLAIPHILLKGNARFQRLRMAF